MPYELWCRYREPGSYTERDVRLSSYETRELARWWGVNLLSKGSVIYQQGTDEEVLIPSYQIGKIYYKQVP